MSEPIADGVPPLPALHADRLEVDATAPDPGAVEPDVRADDTAASTPRGRHRIAEPERVSRAERRAQARGEVEEGTSWVDHPAVLVALSVLALVALVVGLDLASQGTVVGLLPAVLLVVAYVVVVRRRRSRR